MERWQIVYVLPTEVWVKIFRFPWITRKKFGQLVARIGNNQFGGKAQYYLHKCGKHNLGFLHFDENGLNNDGENYLDIPQTPLPENIKSFNEVAISRFDMQTVDFLDKIRPLLTNLEIDVETIPLNRLGIFRTILTTLAPMLNGISVVYCGTEPAFSMVKEQFFRENQDLAQLKMLEIDFVSSEMERQGNLNFVMNWLAQPDNGEPRLLELNFDYEFAKRIIEEIRQQFYAATTPHPRIFTVNLIDCRDNDGDDEFAEFHLENGFEEELHGKWTKVDGEEAFQIIRHQAGWDTEKVQKGIDEMTKDKDYPCIWINKPTLGAIEAAAEQMDVHHVDEATVQQPSSSKDA